MLFLLSSVWRDTYKRKPTLSELYTITRYNSGPMINQCALRSYRIVSITDLVYIFICAVGMSIALHSQRILRAHVSIDRHALEDEPLSTKAALTCQTVSQDL